MPNRPQGVVLPRRRRDRRARIAGRDRRAGREGLTTWSSSSTATCSAWTARCAATARSSRSWKASSSAAPAGTRSRPCGAGYWDPLLARDGRRMLAKLMMETVDGDYQNFRPIGGAYTASISSASTPETRAMVANTVRRRHLAPQPRRPRPAQGLCGLPRGGEPPPGQPTVILAKTVKGYGMGKPANRKHRPTRPRSSTRRRAKPFRDRFNMPIPTTS